MKRIKLTTTAALLVAIAAFTVSSAKALTLAQVQGVKNTVLGVPVPEMPAKAAELVKAADKKDRQAVAVVAVRAIVAKHRAAAPLVISAVAKAAPDLAAFVAVAAAEVVHEQAPMIARAAVASSPSLASEIKQAVSVAVPAQAALVASSVNSMNIRGLAGEPTPEGNITISTLPINSDTGGAGNGRFPNQPPIPAQDPVILYNQPPTP